jgi:hypothetical protein
MFYSGLKPEVKDYVSMHKHADRPTTFDFYIQFVIDCDNRAHERAVERKTEQAKSSKSSSSHSNSRPSAPSRSNNPSSHSSSTLPPQAPVLPPGIPMEIDATRTSKPRGPITAAEKLRRRENNLCLYCGGSAHSIQNCPNMNEAARKRFAEGKKALPSGKA